MSSVPSTGPGPVPPNAAEELVLPSEEGQPLRLGPTALSGQQVGGADAVLDQVGAWQVTLDFRGDGGGAWQRLTGKAAAPRSVIRPGGWRSSWTGR